MIIGYCRVSTKGQIDGNSLESQTNNILDKYPCAEIIEESFSGAKERPIFNQVIDKLNAGDTLVVTKLDRFCRTVKEGLHIFLIISFLKLIKILKLLKDNCLL